MSQSVFVQPQSWQCPACGTEGDYGYCCDGGTRHNHRVPVFPAETTDEQIGWSLPGGTAPRHLLINRREGVVSDAGPATIPGPRDAFGGWTEMPYPPALTGRVVAYIR